MIDLLAEPPSTDIAWQIVNAVLPSEATTMYGRVLQVFNSVLFFLGGLFFAYQALQGIVASARTGQALGERWHTIWTPLRVVVGLGLLVPTPQTGFSSVHYLLRDFVARPGINLGNALSNTGITTVVKEGVNITPASSNGSSIAMMNIDVGGVVSGHTAADDGGAASTFFGGPTEPLDFGQEAPSLYRG